MGIAKTRRGRREKEENNNKDGALTPLLNLKGYCKLVSEEHGAGTRLATKINGMEHEFRNTHPQSADL